MLKAVLYCVVMSILWQNVRSHENLVIQRGIRDRITFPGCVHGNLSCSKKVYRSDNVPGKPCTCECKKKYVTYRDPFVGPKNGSEYYDKSQDGCAWNDFPGRAEGCLALTVRGRDNSPTFSQAIIIDLARSGNMELSGANDKIFDGCNITAYIREPGFQRNQWEKVYGVVFDLEYKKYVPHNIYRLKWELTTSDTHAYQGLVMKLDLNGCCSGETGCALAKTAGNFSTHNNTCRRRTVNGRCCVFPYQDKKVEYNNCVNADKKIKPWCVVNIKYDTGEEAKVQENCSDQGITVTATTSPLVVRTCDPSTTPLKLGKTTSSSFDPTTTGEPGQDTPHGSSTSTNQLQSRTSSDIDSRLTAQPDQTDHSLLKSSSPLVPTTMEVPDGDIVVTAADDDGSDDNSWLDLGYTAIICVSLLFVVVVVLFVCYFRRKVGKRNPTRDLSDKEFEEAPFAATHSSTSLRSQSLRNIDDSIELMEQGDIEGCLDADAGPSNQWSVNESDNPAGTQVYTAPEANYSLIVKPIIHRVRSDANPLPSTEDKSSISSVLENEHDAQERDSDRVFVELNPLYGTVEFPNGKDEPRSD